MDAYLPEVEPTTEELNFRSCLCKNLTFLVCFGHTYCAERNIVDQLYIENTHYTLH